MLPWLSGNVRAARNVIARTGRLLDYGRFRRRRVARHDSSGDNLALRGVDRERFHGLAVFALFRLDRDPLAAVQPSATRDGDPLHAGDSILNAVSESWRLQVCFSVVMEREPLNWWAAESNR